MRATHRALCEHGYADVTMQKIADESDRCKGTLHYHFETKRDLLAAYLEFLHARFVDRVSAAVDESAPPDERLLAFFERAVSPPDRGRLRAFQTALLEIKAQAPYEGAFRERLAAVDGYVHDTVADVVREGVAEGTFRADVDPDDVASFVVTVFNGVHTREVVGGSAGGDGRAAGDGSAGDGPPTGVEAQFAEYVARTLRADAADGEVAAE